MSIIDTLASPEFITIAKAGAAALAARGLIKTGDIVAKGSARARVKAWRRESVIAVDALSMAGTESCEEHPITRYNRNILAKDAPRTGETQA
jgi:hypothetical protein